MRSLLAVFGLLASFMVQAGEFQPVRDSVVKITMDPGLCSAVVISPTRLLTAKHCVASKKVGDTVDVQGDMVATVLKKDEKTDLALLELKAGTLKPIRVCSRPAEQDDYAVLVGFPLGIGQIVTEGRIQFVEDGNTVATTQGIFGNSGGGLFVVQDKKYCLLGIASMVAAAKNQAVYHIMMSVEWKEIKRFLGEGTQPREARSSRNGVFRFR